MMLEEAGYNPFVEGGQEVELQAGGHGVEADPFHPPDNRRQSFIESKSPTSTSNSLHSSQSSLHSSQSSLHSSPYSSLRLITPEERKETQLKNPFFMEEPPVEESQGDNPTVIALPPSSPLNKTQDKLPLPLVRSASERLAVPLASSSSSSLVLSSPPAMSRSNSSLYTYNSFVSSPASVVTVDKVDWVPDEYSLVCEHCANLFTFIKRRHHCRVCGHLYCGECTAKITLPPTLGFSTSQKSCLRCAYKVVRTRGLNTATTKSPDGLSIGQTLSGKMHNFMYRMAGMYDGGKFDRFAGGLASPLQFSTYQIAEVIELKIPSYDSVLLKARAYIPKGDGPFPLLVYIPGGAFVLGDVDSSVVVAFCKELCAKVECIVIAVGYRLAPEQHYPVQWEDCYTAVKWIYESSTFDLAKVEKDPKIVVCGEGSGGLLAAAVCHMARDRGSPPIRFQLLITPWLNLTNLNLAKFDDSYVITRDLMGWVTKQIFQDPEDQDKPYVSPLLAPSHYNLPPTKIITAGYDPLRFEGEEYAGKLRESEVHASVTRYENSFHGFVGKYVDSYSESEEALFECVVCLREVFGFGEFAGATQSPKAGGVVSSGSADRL